MVWSCGATPSGTPGNLDSSKTSTVTIKDAERRMIGILTRFRKPVKSAIFLSTPNVYPRFEQHLFGSKWLI